MDVHPLRRWRQDQNLSLEALARIVGVKRSTLSLYETRRRIPRPRIMEELRKASGGAISAKDFYPIGEAAE